VIYIVNLKKFYQVYNYVIYTDGGILQRNGFYDGASSIVVTKLVNENNKYTIKVCYYNIFTKTNTTNNECEIIAILEAINYIINTFDNIHRVAIISDSKISIKGLTEWYTTKWLDNSKDGILYNSSNKEVSNQKYFNNIIWNIITYNINVQLYHCKGHVTQSIESLNNAKRVFKESNGIICDDDLISTISFYNNYADSLASNLNNDIKFLQMDNIISYNILKNKYIDKYLSIVNNKEGLL